MRALLLELERLYNHVADLGALGNDVGFALANTHAQRIREQLLRINAAVTGHRLLRGAIRPGAVALRTPARPRASCATIAADLAEVVELALRNSVVHDRFTGTAVLTADEARDLGSLGYVARASGLPQRRPPRTPPAPHCPSPRSPSTDGDVLARFSVRARRVRRVRRAGRATSSSSHTGPTEYTAARSAAATGPRSRDRHRRRLARHDRAPRRNRRRRPAHPSQDRRPVLVQLARPAGRAGRHDRPGLPTDQQELQPVLRRQRPVTPVRQLAEVRK